MRVFQEWLRNRYSVFPEAGFKNDARFPEYYQPESNDEENGGGGDEAARVRNQGCPGVEESEEAERGAEEDTDLMRKRGRRIGDSHDHQRQWVSTEFTLHF